jgi:hypothetical protein
MQFLSPFKIHSEGYFFDAVRAKGRPFFVSFFGRAKKESKQITNGQILHIMPGAAIEISPQPTNILNTIPLDLLSQ